MHRYWSPVAGFARSLEAALGHPVQVNAYITPPGSQGFDLHQDDHDVFVLQSHGSKRWVVHERHDLPPTRAALIEVDLGPGDSLYIPKQLPARRRHPGLRLRCISPSGSCPSGRRRCSRRRFGCSRRMESSTSPCHSGSPTSQQALSATVDERLDRIGELLMTKVDRDAVGGRLQRRFFTTRQPLLSGQMRRMLDLDQLSDRSWVEVRTGALCLLQPRAMTLAVLLGDRELRMPALWRR